MTINGYLETIKAKDGEIFNLSYHQKRYESVLSSMGCKKFQNLSEHLSPPKEGLYKCRLVYTTKRVEVQYVKYVKRQIKSLKLVYDNEIDYSLKSTNRDKIDDLFQKRENCDDILIVKNSLLTDTSVANVALLKNGVWHTPKQPLLKGTARERFLEEGKIVESNIKVDELCDYDKIALLNAMLDFDIIAQANVRKIIC